MKTHASTLSGDKSEVPTQTAGPEEKKKKRRKFTRQEKDLYVLGFTDGVHEADKQIKLYQLTAKQLRKAVWDLDKINPRVGILLGRNAIERIIEALRKPTQSDYLIRRLAKAKRESEDEGTLVVVETRLLYRPQSELDLLSCPPDELTIHLTEAERAEIGKWLNDAALTEVVLGEGKEYPLRLQKV